MFTYLKCILVLAVVATLCGAAQAAPAFPVKYSANSRYLVDQNDTPFPIMGRTAWFVVSLSAPDYRTFIDDTAARGYSAIELHVINHDPRGNNPPFGGNGALPFLKRLDGTAWNGVLCCSSADFNTPNESYWSFVDGLLAYCESKGILVFMFPAYVGYQGGDQGWMQEMVANGPAKMQTYGAWIATRYKNQKNLVWMMGGDMGTAPYTFNSAQTAVESALLTGLKSVAGQQSVFFSAEWNSESIATDQTSFGSQMTLNGAYAHAGDVNTQGRRAYAHSPTEPSFLVEGPYDQEGLDGNGWNDAASQPVRRFQWWAWLSTIGGYISGNGYVWPFNAPTWQNHLDTQGSRDMARLNVFIGSITWYNLVPSGLGGMRTLITAGGSAVNSGTYVAASATPDGTLLVAYIPPDHTGSITVDMGAMSSPARARWFDPATAAYTSIGTGLANSGARSFTPPGNNSTGYRDWVLVLDSGTGNTAPTISNIPDQLTTVNTPTPTISFTINDVETPAASLTLSRDSSNPALAPTNNIVFGGSGGNRTVTITPATGLTGSATITVRVSDGTNLTSDTFVLTVAAVNTPPTISGVSDQSMDEDTTSGLLTFTVADAETPPASLTLGKASSNPTLVPVSNIVFGGSGSSRTVMVTPAANQSGTATITMSVTDGQYTASTNFAVTVNAVNDAPTISAIGNQTISLGATAGPLNFTVGDVETPAASLTINGDSSNPTLVPVGNIVLGGSGSSRTVTITPASGLTGSATITLSVSDGTNNTTTSFTLNVSTLITGTVSFTNAAAITIPDVGVANPYPSTINVSGVGGTVSNVTVTMRNLTHTWTRDLDILLVGPGGQKVMLCSDAGNGGANNVTFTLSDAAASALPLSQLVSGTYRPGDYETGDVLPAPAPARPYATTLSAFNGQTPNGTWVLYVFDDGPGDLGSFAGGWSLALTTVGGSGPVSQPPTISDIPNQSTTANLATPAIPFTIGDPDSPVASLILGKASSNAALVPTNNIIFGGSGSNRTVTVTPATGLTGSAAITVSVSDGTNSASDTFVLTVTAVNTPPTISGISDQLIDEDTASGPLSFTIGDGETAAASLTLGKGSSNPTLVPTNNIVFGGSGATRTVTVTPTANQNGTTLVTLSVSDGQFTASTNFLLTVSAVNDLPSISGLANQTISVNATSGPLSLTVGDVETPAANLTLIGASTNPTMVPASNIVFGGSGTSRTVTITPAAGLTGSATITLSVGDGQDTVSTSFVLTVSSLLTGARSFTNATSITIPDRGAATPYPSTINVAGLAGTISNVTLSLRNLSHTWTTDLDVLLVSPAGQKVVVMSDAGSGGANNITLTLSDAAATALPLASLTSSTYRPANYTDNSSGGDKYPAPAPAVPYAAALSAFNGQSANGVWSLYVFDDGPGDLGSFAGGWILTVTTSGLADVRAENSPRIISVDLQPDGTMRLTAKGTVGLSYALEASSDWVSWMRVDMQANTTGSVALSEQPTTNSSRYYRVVSAP